MQRGLEGAKANEKHTYLQTRTNPVCKLIARTDSGLQWVIKQLTFDKWRKTVVVSAGPGPSLCTAERLRVKKANARIPLDEYKKINKCKSNNAHRNKCTSTCSKQVATPSTDEKEKEQDKKYPTQVCGHVHLCLLWSWKNLSVRVHHTVSASILNLLAPFITALKCRDKSCLCNFSHTY